MSGFIALSLFLGLFFTYSKSFGYSMGDAFTLAGYVVAVGALVCSFILACHYPRCRCWTVVESNPRSRERDVEETLELYELQAEAVNHASMRV